VEFNAVVGQRFLARLAQFWDIVAKDPRILP
jgi:hypothetical protein